MSRSVANRHGWVCIGDGVTVHGGDHSIADEHLSQRGAALHIRCVPTARLRCVGRCFTVGEGVSLRLSGCTVTPKTPTGGGKGGCIRLARGAALHWQGGALHGCAADYGGAVHADVGATMHFVNATLQDNHAAKAGGGVYVNLKGKLVAAGTAFLRNTAGGHGGAVSLGRRGAATQGASGGARAAISHSAFTGNRATIGGGVYACGTMM
eukprot:gene5525-1927_t